MYSDHVYENRDGGYIEYSIRDPFMYYETGKKVLDYQQTRIGVLPCFKKEINGAVILSYKISAFKTLREYSETADFSMWDSVMFKLLQVFVKIKENGFLKTGNIEVSADKIFINIADGSLRVICLPLYKLLINETEADERERLRALLIEHSPKLTVSEKNILLAQINEHFGAEQNSGLLTEEPVPEQHDKPEKNNGWIENLFKKHTEQKRSPRNTRHSKQHRIRQGRIVVLRPIGGGEPIEIAKPIFYIGSDAGLSPDLIIPKERKVSGMHCKLIVEKKKINVLDCGSEYGTYINDMRLEPNVVSELHIYDIITIGDIKYSVE